MHLPIHHLSSVSFCTVDFYFFSVVSKLYPYSEKKPSHSSKGLFVYLQFEH